ncbi:hypothetical protein A3A63_02880 [Candidatus Gottesmanbacteria bacterium RIFCSPLOWO2_01_FULL_46_9]|uniref:Uncharacterized protein n=1 Tax=Candidatus Gottesmanbacteria bacterium RIFCSPLOWO2_01_FULL_46_9 TaxID=1798394 RepID=A0A1F6B159_9BACT|nr:MAG: hypothetical protein A3A63_02880 [Candidatus Gottesmanbacteria bacterium RIFCSPLOWO2_01_FULL_46_9]
MTEEPPPSDQAVFRPKPTRIVITAADIEAARIQREQSAALPPDTTHPFDRPLVKELLDAEFSEMTDAISHAVRPVKSDTPDDLEEWEVTMREKRQDQIPGEAAWPYLVRSLYEEFFSVNQNPDLNPPPMQAHMPGLTPGGLVSHFYNESVMDDASVKTEVAKPFVGRTMSEAIRSLREANTGEDVYRSNRSFAQIVQLVTRRNDAPFDSPWRVLRPERGADEVYLGSDRYQEIYPELDSVGYRLLAILRARPG